MNDINRQHGLTNIILAFVVALALVVGVGGYYLFQNRTTVPDQTTHQTENNNPTTRGTTQTNVTENKIVVPKTVSTTSPTPKKTTIPTPKPISIPQPSPLPLSTDEVGWRPSASRPALQPVETPDGILLTAERDGDESTITLDVTMPEKLPGKFNTLDFDMKFQEEGDGDWLEVTFNDVPLLGYAGTSYFPSNGQFQNVDMIPIGHLAGFTGILKFMLHGQGTTISSVLIKNIKFISY